MSDMPRILVIEHSPQLAKLLALTLAEEGYVVEALVSPGDVVPEVRRCRPHLLILDLVPHRRDAFKVLDALQADGVCCTVPAVVLSTVHEVARAATRWRQVRAYVTKPFELEQMVAAVRGALDVAQIGAELTVERAVDPKGMSISRSRAAEPGPGRGEVR